MKIKPPRYAFALPALNDKKRVQLAWELENVELAFDLMVDAKTALAPGDATVDDQIVFDSVLRYLETRHLAICMWLADNVHSRRMVIQSAAQLSISQNSMRAVL